MNIRTRNQRGGKRRANCRQRTCAKRLASRSSSRRGILLLVVLSLLTLFLMIGMAFIIAANQYRRANKSYARAEAASNSPSQHAKLLDEVLSQLLRDTNNQNSSLRYHSLLRDLYGNDGFTAQIDFARWSAAPGAPDVTSSQMFEFDLYNVEDVHGDMINVATGLSPVANAYNGLLLTFLDGKLRGQSTRIVGYRPPNTFMVMAVPQADGTPMSQIAALNHPTDGIETSRILINGRPFNGTGAGYNVDPLVPTGAARLTAAENQGGVILPVALLPNGPFLDTDAIPDLEYLTQKVIDSFPPADATRLISARKSQLGLEGAGGSDESYDAPDFQNLYLALMPSNPGESADPTGGVLMDVSGRQLVLPSFHRPALLNYWNNQLPGNDLHDEANVALLRKVLLRPNWHDHPNFTGSNPEFASILANDDLSRLEQMIFGPWDVDNDNDGTRDSQWIDYGGEIIEGPDGKLIKPLAAIMVLDMEGRLNLNAHGTLEMVRASGDLPPAQQLAGIFSDRLPRGEGYGPADISLHSVVTDYSASAPTIFEKLMLGDSTSGYPGRYGVKTDPMMSQVMPGVPDTYGMKVQLKQQGMPNNIDGTRVLSAGPDMTYGTADDTAILGEYATLPDLMGRYSLGLNDFGQPVYEALTDTGAPTLGLNPPYELDLSAGGSRGTSASSSDGPFTMAEMERLLRAYDVDAGTLPPRLWELANKFQTIVSGSSVDVDELDQWRTLLTTDSFDMPVPSVVLPDWVHNGLDGAPGTAPTSDDFDDVMGRSPVGASFAELLQYRLRVGLGLLDPTAFDALPSNDPMKLKLRSELAKLLATDAADGLRMDVNRPVGNGRDDNNNGVVDEPGESEAPFWMFDGTGPPAFTNTTGNYRDDVDRDGDLSISATDQGEISGMGAAGVDTTEELVKLHNYRRQMLARHFYVMAMALADPPSAAMTVKDKKSRARRLAQWAINIVDFRDPDNCMTPFEFDYDPFDGWDVDGNISTINDRSGADAIPGNDDDAEVVWGCERPELLMTETFAWHDRRTEDDTDEEPANDENGDGNTNQQDKGSTGGQPPTDTDFDQVARPRGAAFIELYNPWPANPAVNADTHDKLMPPGYDMGVDLARTHDQTPTGSPVWRMMVYKDGGPLKDPEDPETANRPTLIDRSVYFHGADPGYDDDGRAFFNDLSLNPVPSVRPGRHLVVGSGDQSGPGVYVSPIGDQDIQGWPDGIRRIQLETDPNAPNAVCLFDEDDTPVMDEAGFPVMSPSEVESSAFMPPLSYDSLNKSTCNVAIIDQVDVGGVPVTRRFTLTEPAGGYPANVLGSSWSAAAGYYADAAEVRNNSANPRRQPIDIPLDDQRTDGELRLSLNDKRDRTIPAFSWIYLQRLANPLLPWNPESGHAAHNNMLAVNPYLTVDSTGAHVTVFNGRGKGPAGQGSGEVRGSEYYDNAEALSNFCSLQRGRKNDPAIPPAAQEPFAMQQGIARAGKQGESAPWAFDPVTPASILQNPWNPEHFNLWVNKGGPTGRGIGRVTSQPTHFFNAIPDCTLGFMNEPFRQSTVTTATVRNRLVPTDASDNSSPFPWLTWNNRPYISGHEVMMVPRSRSSQLLREFSFVHAGGKDPYDKTKVPSETDDGAQSQQGLFGHLPNMFLSEAPAATQLPDVPAGLSRVLEYVHVPSKFVGTETWLNPATFGDTTTPVSSPNDPRYSRQPPFNRISNYRDPGRVNLNTVIDPAVWDGGIMHRQLQSVLMPWDPITNKFDVTTGHIGPTLSQLNSSDLVSSRRGYTNANIGMLETTAGRNLMLALDDDYPTFFANPFRSPDAGELVPLGTAPSDMTQMGVNCTVLRQDTLSAAPKPPLFDPATTTPHNNSARNAYFNYQPVTRISNLTTTRSNVFAVWITIGFFEVEELNESDHAAILQRFGTGAGTLDDAQTDPLFTKVYSGGYMLGRELGSETGDVQRIREFAIIDRTIPVAFEPGEDHNVERAIRLRRFLE